MRQKNLVKLKEDGSQIFCHQVLPIFKKFITLKLIEFELNFPFPNMI